MYWNLVITCVVGSSARWIVTLDVLKLIPDGKKADILKLNSNIRCIEIAEN